MFDKELKKKRKRKHHSTSSVPRDGSKWALIDLLTGVLAVLGRGAWVFLCVFFPLWQKAQLPFLLSCLLGTEHSITGRRKSYKVARQMVGLPVATLWPNFPSFVHLTGEFQPSLSDSVLRLASWGWKGVKGEVVPDSFSAGAKPTLCRHLCCKGQWESFPNLLSLSWFVSHTGHGRIFLKKKKNQLKNWWWVKVIIFEDLYFLFLFILN